MFLLLRLILGHLIADFPLQTDEIYRLKIRGWKGTAVHAAVVSIVMAAAVFPYLGKGWVWLLILLVGLTHVLEDRFKIRLENRISNRFFLFVMDQWVHLALIFLFYFLIPPLHALGRPDVGTGFWAKLYLNDFYILVLIGYLLVSFAAPYFLNTFTTTFFKNQRRDVFLSRMELYHGLLERAAVFSLLLLGEGWLFGIPLILLARIPFKALRSGLHLSLTLGTTFLVFLGIKLLALFF